jgi:transposase InsO family protein
VKYAYIAELKEFYSVQQLCAALDVSPAGYYASLKRPPSRRATENARLDVHIRASFTAHRSRYGSPRVTRELRESGLQVGENRVAKRMGVLSLQAKGTRKYKATTDSKHNLPVAPNLLEQNFQASKPNEKWVTDTTYLWTEEGWLYLAVVMDLYSRMIVGYALSEHNDRHLVMDALRRALWRRHFPSGVIVHSDRGSTYCSKDYRDLLDEHGLECSMSKRGDCFDNAAMESFFHSMKVDTIHGEKLATHFSARYVVDDYIDPYYNTKRQHSTIGYQSPTAFEKRNAA